MFSDSYDLLLFIFMNSQESHGRTMLSLTKTDENLSSSLLNITALEKSLSAADEKYKFTQKLRDFVSVLCNFLQVCYLQNNNMNYHSPPPLSSFPFTHMYKFIGKVIMIFKQTRRMEIGGV